MSEPRYGFRDALFGVGDASTLTCSCRVGGTDVTPSEVITKSVAHDVEGLTLLGGEPFDQAGALSVLAAHAQARGLGLICFTGFTGSTRFTMDHAAAKPGGVALLEYVDLLIDGPYIAAKPESRRALVGSTNQRFILLTDHYRDSSPEQASNRVDLRISPSGEVTVAGFLTSEKVSELADALDSRRTRRN